MGRLARLVFPGLPHHVTQRGNGRAQTFFDDADYVLYRDLLAASCRAANVEIWSWVLMPNHVHLILTPADADGIRRALAPVHRGYAGAIHARLRRTGHFWQGRFGAVAMDESTSGGSGAVCGTQSGPGAAPRPSAGLALVERALASVGQRRRHHDALAGAQSLSSLCRVHR